MRWCIATLLEFEVIVGFGRGAVFSGAVPVAPLLGATLLQSVDFAQHGAALFGAARSAIEVSANRLSAYASVSIGVALLYIQSCRE